MKRRIAAAVLISFAIGLLLGAAAIHRPIPKAPLELPNESVTLPCWALSEQIGNKVENHAVVHFDS